MSHKIVDYLIVGQGLAGSCLALQLAKKNKSVFVLDEPEKNRASAVAAGLFNPITGKIMTKTWRADELFPFLNQFYREAEQFLQSKFYYPRPLYRPFISVEEQNEWMGKSSGSSVSEFIESVFSSSAFSQHVNDSFGGLLLKSCGYLDTSAFIQSVRNWLIQSGCFKVQKLEEDGIGFKEDKVVYEDILAGKIVFCNGLGVADGKFFQSIPLRSLKGETILVQTDQMLERLYNRGVYVVPTSTEGIYKVGATYNVKDQSESVTESGQRELMEKLGLLMKIPFQWVGHDWGKRPTTPDRRPILGPHPDHPNLVMFNGLGTKGVSLAPYYSNQLANWLVGNGEIEGIVAISRFY
jgi:glycine oxidase